VYEKSVKCHEIRHKTIVGLTHQNMKSSDAKASKCHMKFSSRMIIFNQLVYLSSVISLK